MLSCAGACWMPDIGESPRSLKEEDVSSSWQILEEHVPEKYYLKPAICNWFLRLAKRTGCPPPAPVEYLLQKKKGENTRRPTLSRKTHAKHRKRQK